MRSYKANHNKDKAPLFFVAKGDTPRSVNCVFCGCNDLRVCGPFGWTYLGCPECGADGPVGGNLDEAVRLYLKRTDEVTENVG